MVCLLTPLCHAGENEFDALRLKWRTMLIGAADYDPSDPDIRKKLTQLDEEVAEYSKSMNRKPKRAYLWSMYEDPMLRALNFKLLKRMSLAFSSKGSKFFGDRKLLADVLSGLDWLYANRYNEKTKQYGRVQSWFHPEIYIPQLFSDITVLLHDELSDQQRNNYTAAVQRFCSDMKSHWFYHNASGRETYGANRVYRARALCISGILLRDGKKIAMARDGLSPVFKYTKSGTGFYRDGSFIQHGRHPYTGGYGVGLLRDVGMLLELLDKSRWAVTDKRRSNAYRWVRDAYQPIMYKGNAMDMVRGRTIAQQYANGYTSGYGVVLAAARIARSAPPQDATAIRRMVKYWTEENTVYPVKDLCDLQELLLLKSVVDDPKVVSRGDLSLCKVFANMDRVVHHRLGFTFAISMFSDRVYNYENIIKHNTRGWYTGYGMTWLYNSDLAQYVDNYWPTIDQQRLAGTTVARDAKPKHRLLNRNDWVGGVEWQGTFGCAGMWLQPPHESLQARKSWFMFDDEIVALGSGISCKDDRVVETIVENRRLDGKGENALLVNGKEMSTASGWSEVLKDVSWLHLAGNTPVSDIGVVCMRPTGLHALRSARTGTWSEVGARRYAKGGEDKKFTRTFMTLWFDHGKKPTNATYGFVTLPNQSAEAVKRYADSPEIEILAHNNKVHAVREKTTGLCAANFWTTEKVSAGPITCTGKAAVAFGRTPAGELYIAVADPTHKGTVVNLEIAAEATGVVSKDKAITVEQQTPTIRLIIAVKGQHGRSIGITMKQNMDSKGP